MRAEPGHAKRLAAQFRAEEGLLLPAAFLHGAIGRWDGARQGEHERTGVFGDADAVGARGVDNEDPAGAGRLDVHVVHARAGARDDSEARRGREEAGVHFGGASHEQGVRIGEIVRKGFRRTTAARIDGPAVGLQQLQRRSGKRICDDDFHQTGQRGVLAESGPMLRR